jgi:hypothetical protein
MGEKRLSIKLTKVVIYFVSENSAHQILYFSLVAKIKICVFLAKIERKSNELNVNAFTSTSANTPPPPPGHTQNEEKKETNKTY